TENGDDGNEGHQDRQNPAATLTSTVLAALDEHASPRVVVDGNLTSALPSEARSHAGNEDAQRHEACRQGTSRASGGSSPRYFTRVRVKSAAGPERLRRRRSFRSE